MTMPPNFDGLSNLSLMHGISGDSTKISRGVLEKANSLALYLETTAIITSGYRPQSTGSQHALGLAVDLMFPDYAGSLHDVYLAAERFNFQGLGVYPTWQYSGRKIGGVHVDTRAGKSARWIGLGNDSSQRYIALNSLNLKNYGVI